MGHWINWLFIGTIFDGSLNMQVNELSMCFLMRQWTSVLFDWRRYEWSVNLGTNAGHRSADLC